ncbi:PQQ-dependent sugar dehydrogenase [Mucilaginibacter sp. Bleaf8]|uniref:PQQ-dependent sugar dehydrogenase n=1 Tax=Mucilaginibacter sp. Bleaf8 TaxID=2834430 RepID=UPI001BCFE309|nr:PQQ-dependent sugar dehydrogenase [Mucilaginibacter sp. Bleaf8]MBS7563707.1 PQQ-dependent sugar dehydrogenase [Mucilaginibacter sp. Bleaf8]
MKKHLLLICLLAICIANSKAQQLTGPIHEKFTMRVVAAKLSDPWEITYGPDNYLWITEAKGYRVSRINPATGSKTVLLDLNGERKFPRYDRMPKGSNRKPWPQGGLMGMALHPQLLKGQPYVYLAYVYYFEGADSTGDGCKVNYGGCFFKTKIVRYEYNASTQKLFNPITLCDTIPNSSDHNSGRLLIAPVGNKSYLFYTVGDLGAGQFDNGGRPNHAQEKNVYEGKVLRFNLSPDANTDAGDKWVPDDNPFNGSRQNAVWSYGHRNAQGLSYGVINGKGYIYSSEHGPYSDDEINIIEKGKNYGHPLIIGYADGNYNGLAASVSDRESLPDRWHTTYPLIEDEKANAKRIGATVYRDPILSLNPNNHTMLTDLFNKVLSHQDNGGWPSEAPSSIDVYTSAAIPGWQNSLLIPTLKGHKLIRVKLNTTGNKTVGDTLTYFSADVRYRDIAISPDGKKLYLATDSSSVSSGPSKQNPDEVQIKGAILEFTYAGQDNGQSQPAQSPMQKEKATDCKRNGK